MPDVAGARKPVVGVLCCNEVADRPIQAVATRFVMPLTRWSGATVLLVPAISEASDAASLAGVLDGLLLTGSRSHVSPSRYGGEAGEGPFDAERDEVALALAGRMIEAGKPVFGICRGMQELNVLFGGTLSRDRCRDRHHRGERTAGGYAALFEHRHDVTLTPDGVLARATGAPSLHVTSVHEQAVERLGAGLAVEAVASDDGVIEAIAARPCGADVLAVQWHPEWDVAQSPASQRFFALIGEAVGSDSATFALPAQKSAGLGLPPRGH